MSQQVCELNAQTCTRVLAAVVVAYKSAAASIALRDGFVAVAIDKVVFHQWMAALGSTRVRGFTAQRLIDTVLTKTPSWLFSKMWLPSTVPRPC